jgi:hypothetical protein
MIAIICKHLSLSLDKPLSLWNQDRGITYGPRSLIVPVVQTNTLILISETTGHLCDARSRSCAQVNYTTPS